MTNIEKIIKNIETIKSRDSANHKGNCNCELCGSLTIAKYMKSRMDEISRILKTYNGGVK